MIRVSVWVSRFTKVRDSVWLPWASMLMVFLGPQPNRDAAGAFFEKVRPPGWWRPFGRSGSRMPALLGAWALGVVGIYGVLLGAGKLLLGGPWLGVLLLALGAGGWFGSRALVKAAERSDAS